MKKSINRNTVFTFLLSTLISVSANADSLLKKYIREHSFKPVTENILIDSPLLQKPHETSPLDLDMFKLKPHEETPLAERFRDIFERFEHDNGFQLELDSILNGGSLDAITDTDVWWMLRGGELTGNGGGIVEVKFEYHYDRLGKYIDDCIRSFTVCSISEEDAEVLGQIKDIANEKKSDPTRLIFLSGAENPKFFKESEGPWGIRTAKTGHAPEIPLFVNTDHLYKNNVPAMSDDEIITIIVHETGHQAKMPDHAYLNRLGSELVNFLKNKSASVQREHRGVVHQVDFTNFEASHQDAEATLTYAGEQIDLRPLIKDSLSCPHPDQRVIGFELSNPFWKRESQQDGLENFPMGLWAQVNCQFMHQRIVYKRDVDVTLHFLFSQKERRLLEEVHVEINK